MSGAVPGLLVPGLAVPGTVASAGSGFGFVIGSISEDLLGGSIGKDNYAGQEVQP